MTGDLRGAISCPQAELDGVRANCRQGAMSRL